ncbi:U32 family peptidase [Wohlfahrtiimonas chitiniclastica]|uniref:peptidase U32 family protein n=1 Tax=Wohlfahrtiimonas chitiniclastica TaxID=400946 RepID=UPI001BCAC895|nr:U32 family peptidase [Wohlfahrtiimonas chitiniclastica]
MMLKHNQLELLSPARDIEIGREAILHGADAVYLGGPSFGARYNADNSVSDIAKLVEFANPYHAKVFVTLNTILHDDELPKAQKLITELYDAGVDALIVQDMGVLQLDIPPIELHASTQTDIRTLDRAKFLSQVGFSQLVLARELSLKEISAIHEAVDTPLEFFIHGALCVAFSGQCYISHADTGRSANRGDCSQACRLPYTLKDKEGRVVAFEKHLLSMKDNNQTENLGALVKAGVRSFKIEGRYKDMAYVKNITAHYRKMLDQFLEGNPEYTRSSLGKTVHHFVPNTDKTFNRGATDYFVNARKEDIGAFDSPKFRGVEVGEVLKFGGNHLEVKTSEPLANGDGLNVLIKREVVGFRASEVKEIGDKHYLVYWHEDAPENIEKVRIGQPLYRNADTAWQKMLMRESSTRKIGVDIALTETNGQYQLTLTGEDGLTVIHPIEGAFEAANNVEKTLQNLEEGLRKLGDTIFEATSVVIDVKTAPFMPKSLLNQIRRDAIARLEEAYKASNERGVRIYEGSPKAQYPSEHITYLENVYNHKAREFYEAHGVKLIEPAYEAHQEKGEVPVMITKHCLRFAYNLCPKQAKGIKGVQGQVRAEPMVLMHKDEEIRLEFKCRPCEMHVMGKIKPHVLKSALVGSEA